MIRRMIVLAVLVGTVVTAMASSAFAWERGGGPDITTTSVRSAKVR